jgi:hypothetical protein
MRKFMIRFSILIENNFLISYENLAQVKFFY